MYTMSVDGDLFGCLSQVCIVSPRELLVRIPIVQRAEAQDREAPRGQGRDRLVLATAVGFLDKYIVLCDGCKAFDHNETGVQ